jgi:hypothetical protein
VCSPLSAPCSPLSSPPWSLGSRTLLSSAAATCGHPLPTVVSPCCVCCVQVPQPQLLDHLVQPPLHTLPPSMCPLKTELVVTAGDNVVRTCVMMFLSDSLRHPLLQVCNALHESEGLSFLSAVVHVAPPSLHMPADLSLGPAEENSMSGASRLRVECMMRVCFSAIFGVCLPPLFSTSVA